MQQNLNNIIYTKKIFTYKNENKYPCVGVSKWVEINGFIQTNPWILMDHNLDGNGLMVLMG